MHQKKIEWKFITSLAAEMYYLYLGIELLSSINGVDDPAHRTAQQEFMRSCCVAYLVAVLALGTGIVIMNSVIALGINLTATWKVDW
jgi:hypothetical protein